MEYNHSERKVSGGIHSESCGAFRERKKVWSASGNVRLKESGKSGNQLADLTASDRRLREVSSL